MREEDAKKRMAKTLKEKRKELARKEVGQQDGYSSDVY